MTDAFVFTRLFLPRPLEADTLVRLLSRMMSTDIPRPLSLEVHAAEGEIQHLLGCPKTAVQRLKRLLAGVFPEVRFGAAKRPDVASVSRVVATPSGLPLAEVTDPEAIVAAFFAALASRRGDEILSLQLILGRTHHPAQVPRTVADPGQSLTSRLLEGSRDAPADVHRRLRETAAHPRMDVTVRIGVTSDNPKRQAALTYEIFGALQLLESPGVRLTLTRESLPKWQRAEAARRPLRVTAEQLLVLLGWPLGESNYPGIPPVHPRRLPVAEIVTSTESVFAVSTAPGPERQIGIDPQSRLQHVLAIGPTGSGKSTLLEHLILSDGLAGRACVVIEPKKQLCDSILERAPKEMAGQIVLMDSVDTEAVVGFNPLDAGDRDPHILADGILAALAAVFSDGWGPRTEYLIHGGLLSLAIAGQRRGIPYTLLDLPRILTETSFRRSVSTVVSDDPTLKALWTEFDDMRPGQRAAVVAAPLNKLRKLVMRKPLVAVLGQAQPRFRLRDVFRERKTVLIPLNEALIGAGAATLLGSLIVAELFMAALERAGEKDPQKRPGMVFIDEVQNYLHLPTSLDSALGVFRSYGVGLHVAHQHRNQLPQTMRAAFDANARSKIAFTLEPDDAREIAKQAPELTKEDFQTLPVYEIYARLFAGGVPTNWCSARALPPAPEVGASDEIRQMSRDLYGALPPEPEPVGASPVAPEPGSPPTTGEGAQRRSHQRRRQP